MRKLFIAVILPLFVAATLLTVGCTTAADDDDAGCSSTVIEWTCENDVCTCDDDGNSCTHPDDTDTDDPNNCDILCEVCTD